jgi:hypothetical protein|uniref:Uncharacterized protein n=1 Tax=Zea mays TaxID=4577 RepID=A0A804U689_MAIZE
MLILDRSQGRGNAVPCHCRRACHVRNAGRGYSLHAHLAAPHLLVVLDVGAHHRRGHAPASSNNAAAAAATRRGRRRRLSGSGSASAGALALAAATTGLVVVHPYLEDLPGDPDLPAEAAHLVVPQRAAGLPLGHPPAEPLRQPRHALLLLVRELGPRPAPAPGPGAVRAGVTAHAGRSNRHVVHAVARGRAGRGQHCPVRAAVRSRRSVGEERLPVEVAVAAAGGAEHRCGLAVVGGVLAASVGGVCPELRRVVAHALPVHLPRPLLVLLLIHGAPALLLSGSLTRLLTFSCSWFGCFFSSRPLPPSPRLL